MLMTTEGFYSTGKKDGAASSILEPVARLRLFVNIDEWGDVTFSVSQMRHEHNCNCSCSTRGLEWETKWKDNSFDQGHDGEDLCISNHCYRLSIRSSS
jgi:hypothetical protein